MYRIGKYCVGFIVALVIWSNGYAGIVFPEFQSALNNTAPNVRIPVIISSADQVDISAFASQAPLQRRPALVSALRMLSTSKLRPFKTFQKNKIVQDIHELRLTNGLAVSLPASVVKRLQSIPGTASIRLDDVIQRPQAGRR